MDELSVCRVCIRSVVGTPLLRTPRYQGQNLHSGPNLSLAVCVTYHSSQPKCELFSPRPAIRTLRYYGQKVTL